MSSFRGVYAHRVSSQHGIHLHCIKGGQSKLIESMYGRGNIFKFFQQAKDMDVDLAGTNNPK